MCTLPDSRVPTARSVLVTSAFKLRAVAEDGDADTKSIT